MVQIDESTIEQLERVANLPLSPEERTLILPTLRVWVEDANELNRKMADPRYLALPPAMKFMHGEVEEIEQ